MTDAADTLPIVWEAVEKCILPSFTAGDERHRTRMRTAGATAYKARLVGPHRAECVVRVANLDHASGWILIGHR